MLHQFYPKAVDITITPAVVDPDIQSDVFPFIAHVPVKLGFEVNGAFGAAATSRGLLNGSPLVRYHFLSERFSDVKRDVLEFFIVALVVVAEISCQFVFDLGIVARTLE